MKPLTIHADAEAEVDEAPASYEAQRPGLGRSFREAFEAALAQILRSPDTPALIDPQGTRKVRFRRFPYTIDYVELDEAVTSTGEGGSARSAAGRGRAIASIVGHADPFPIGPTPPPFCDCRPRCFR